jgi:hypothetical protein
MGYSGGEGQRMILDLVGERRRERVVEEVSDCRWKEWAGS